MARKALLRQRLAAIGESLATREGTLALIGLGSSGSELDRLDDFSDLDFFVIVQAGRKGRFLQDLDWLTAVHPVAYAFKNTDDGYKLLFEDGIFCEMAIFEPAELVNIPFTAERVVWQNAAFDGTWLRPKTGPRPDRNKEWLVGEAVTNLYIGLARHHRGEKLSAARFIQGHAVDRVLDLAGLIEEEKPAFRDPFGEERRFEQRFPETAGYLPQFIQGYEKNVESALAILAFLDRHFTVDLSMKKLILELAKI